MRITRETVASPARVWSVLCDLRRWPEWLPTVDAAEPVTPDTVDGIGAAYDLRQPRLRTARWTVTQWHPGAGFTWESHGVGLSTVGRHELAATPQGGTAITLAIEWSGPLAWVARSVYGRLTRRYLVAEVEALAARSEAGAAAS